MKGLRLIDFEIKHQIRNATFIAVLCLFGMFIVTQMREIFHYPINNNHDIEVLRDSGEYEYLFVPTSQDELKSASIQYLQKNIDRGNISLEQVKDVEHVIALLKNNSFDEVYRAMQENEWIAKWFYASKSQFEKKIGSIEEVNHNLQSKIGITGYGAQLYKKYVTYMQMGAALLIFPIFLCLLTRDSTYNMSEILYSQPMSPQKYILCRYLGGLIPLLLFFYGFGITLNIISVIRFAINGWKVRYMFFFKDFVIYILPTILFLSAFIMFIMLIVKKAVAVFPIYMAYVVFNVTPGVFQKGGFMSAFSRVIIRLDTPEIKVLEIMINRGIYLLLAVVMIFVMCKLYDEGMKNNSGKKVTL